MTHPSGHAPRPAPSVQVDVVPLDGLAVGHLVEAVHVLHALTEAPEAAQVGLAHYLDPPGHGAMLSLGVIFPDCDATLRTCYHSLSPSVFPPDWAYRFVLSSAARRP